MRWRRWALLLLALLMFASMVMRRTSMVVGGPDSAGYFNFARMLLAGRLSIDVDPIRELHLDDSWVPVFAPGGFRAAPSGPRIVPTYPIGVPLHLAVLGHFATPLAATVCLLLMVLVARELGLPEWAAWVGAGVLGGFPTFLLTATQPLSDVVATMWALAAVWFALRDRPIPAGIAFAIGVLVRPTNLLLAPAILVAMRAQPRRLAIAAAAALPFGIGLLVLQSALYGSPFETGYGGIGGMLSLEHLRGASVAHARWLATLLTPVVFPCGLLVAFHPAIEKRVRWLLVAWFVPFFAFYAFYGVYDSWGTTRFLLPAVPALILGAMLLIRRTPVVIAAILAIIVVLVPGKQTRVLHVFDIARHEQIYVDTVTWSSRQMPRDAIVVAGLFTGPFLFYENRFTVNWPNLEPERFAELRARSAPRRWYAVLSDVELPPEELRRRYPGRWVAVSRMRDITLWRLEE